MQSFAKGLAVCLAAAFVLLAIIGGIKNYSPVPFWDMWDGYLAFFTRISHGDWSAWWAQHNEHRIVLSRILFWVDLAWLDGTGWFLILVNYLLAAMSVTLFWTILKEKIANQNQNLLIFLLGAFLCIWLFSWVQYENLTWGFQSQFFLAQLVPLAAFYCLHKASIYKESHGSNLCRWFIAACLIGFASLGTMANGILALPILVAMALALRLRWSRTTMLVMLAVTGSMLYFHGYQLVERHGSLRQTLLENPLELTAYTLLYLGGPFYYFLGKGVVALHIAQAMGLVMICSCLYFAYRAVRNPRTYSLDLALLAFLLYIGGTAFGTAGGRAIFGVYTTSRYMTPALMAWAALLMLYLPYIITTYHKNKPLILIPLCALVISMLPAQLKALKSNETRNFEHRIAALALAMRIHDAPQIQTIYPSVEAALNYSEFPLKSGISIFGTRSIRDASKLIGNTEPSSSSITCQGQLYGVQRIENENRYVSVRGWIYNPKLNLVPHVVHILNEQKIIVGYALVGQPRPDTNSGIIDSKAELSGFKGYLLTDQLDQNLIFQGIEPSCAFNATVPSIPYQMKSLKPDLSVMSVTKAKVTAQNEWLGSDSDRTKIDGGVVFGSYINSDQDRATITLNLQRGDSFFYRSGPTGGQQRLEIDGDKRFSTLLPLTATWILLEFSDMNLPTEFTLELIDDGAGWGEWSAIILKN